ncbi:MAG: T9SS type A sorting domain-containing protein [Cryomorphaceae bacterium]|nr:T9SS type A sorting domain-containing protein [Cryomorphaceae bacterium]
MKKILLSIGVVLSAAAANAQVDTLTEFFTGTPTIYGAQGGGYVAGNNSYDDRAKMQLFDGTHGVNGGGSITSLLLWAPAKSDAGTGGTFRAVIWANNAGEPGAELGSVTIPLSQVDTTAAGTMVAEAAVGYNVVATFSSSIAIPANGEFWAGVVLPTTAGDSLGLVTNTDGDFADAVTHTGEFWSDGYPVVNFQVGLTENEIVSSVYPNPASEVLNINLKANATSVSIISMDGKVVSTQNVTSNTVAVDLSNVLAGAYIYEIVAENGTVIRNTFVKK